MKMNLIDMIKDNVPVRFNISPDGTESLTFSETINLDHNVFMVGYIEENSLRFSCRTPDRKYTIIFENFKENGDWQYPKFLDEYLYLKDKAASYN